MDRSLWSDEQLMTAYAAKDDELAFRQLYARHKNRVWAYLQKRLHHPAEVSEVFQRVFLKLHKTRRLFNPQWPFAPWLFQICYQELVSFWRIEKKHRGLFAWEELHSASNQERNPLEEVQTHSLTDVQPILESSAFQSLNPRERDVLASRFIEEKSFAEMARALETSESNVRQILSRALKKLRRTYVRNFEK